MKTLLIYLAGLITPLLIMTVISLYWNLEDFIKSNRYGKAIIKFGLEFDKLNIQQLKEYQSIWDNDPDKYDNYRCDRDRYCAMKWNNGNTKEVR